MASPLAILLFFSLAMLSLPIGGFFVSKSLIYEGESRVYINLSVTGVAYSYTLL